MKGRVAQAGFAKYVRDTRKTKAIFCRNSLARGTRWKQKRVTRRNVYGYKNFFIYMELKLEETTCSCFLWVHRIDGLCIVCTVILPFNFIASKIDMGRGGWGKGGGLVQCLKIDSAGRRSWQKWLDRINAKQWLVKQQWWARTAVAKQVWGCLMD